MNDLPKKTSEQTFSIVFDSQEVEMLRQLLEATRLPTAREAVIKAIENSVHVIPALSKAYNELNADHESIRHNLSGIKITIKKYVAAFRGLENIVNEM